MMQWSLFLLILMGQCCLLMCHLYEYHFVEEKKTWGEAQKYCREKYTDLAKVFNMADMRRLCNSTQNQGEAWIGLYNNTGGTRTWHWSLPGVKYTENNSSWNQSGRLSHEPQGNCGRQRDKWADAACNKTMWFICYNETTKNNKSLHLMKLFVNWTHAQSYCRYNHTDLASGPHQAEGKEMEDLINSETSPFSAWIGLFRDSWRWSDGSDFSFRFWDMQLFNDGQSSKTCATTWLNRSGTWSSDKCDEKKPFFCYDDKVVLIKENKTWEEALYYCRENYRDLVSITDPEEQAWVQEKLDNASTPFVWLGLRYTCTLGFWFWVTDEVVEYKNWNSAGTNDDCDMSGAMDTGGNHTWVTQLDNNMFNFFCSKNESPSAQC